MDDLLIVNLYWERAETAIKETDNKYGKLCKRLANNILNNVFDAEECVNDSYYAVWNSIPDARPQNFQAFLCRIVKNLSFKKLEFLTAHKRKPEYLASLEELEGCLSSSETADTLFDAAELAKKISVFLREQDVTERRIFIRRYWFYDSVKTIADDFGVKESKISAVLFKMRKNLKSFLQKEGYEV